MYPERRRHKRKKVVLPVRLSRSQADGLAAGQLAHTIDITDTGARVGGLRTPIEPGQMITLQRGQAKARFRVIWTKQLGPSELQAGVECAEPNKTIWEFDLDDQNESGDGRKQQEFLMKLLYTKK
jgi:hypothetical protein